MKKILVLGGAGYIGSILVTLLLKKNNYIIVYDLMKFGSDSLRHIKNNKNLKIIKGDTNNKTLLNKISKQCSIVVDLSGIVGDPACNINRKTTKKDNFTNLKDFLKIFKKNKVQRFIYMSSCSVYGKSKGKKLINEKFSVKPISLYAETKIRSEKEMLKKEYKSLNPVILRLSTVFGLSYRLRLDLVINIFTLMASLNKDITVFGGSQFRPNIHVKDVALSIIKVINSPLKLVSGQIFNVGSNKLNYKIIDLGKIVKKLNNKILLKVEKNSVDERNYHISFNKIKNKLNFTPKYSVIKGASELYNYLLKNKIKGHNLKFSNYKIEKKKYVKSTKYIKRIK